MRTMNDVDAMTIDLPVDFSQALLEEGRIEDYFYVKELSQRKLFITDEICFDTTSDIIKNVLQYNREDRGKTKDERKPIVLYVSSQGGSVEAGMQLIDIIRESKTPVYIVNTGICYSVAFLIFLCGDKRFSMKSSTFLMHDGSLATCDSTKKAQDLMRFNDRVESRIKEYVLQTTNITDELYEEKSRVEWYMFADEAKELGIVDYIIGEDCDIDEVC